MRDGGERPIIEHGKRTTKEMKKESMLSRSCLMPCFLYLFEPKSVRPPHSTASAVSLAFLPGININKSSSTHSIRFHIYILHSPKKNMSPKMPIFV